MVTLPPQPRHTLSQGTFFSPLTCNMPVTQWTTRDEAAPINSCAWSGIARSARSMVANKLSNRSFDQAAEPAALDVTFRSSEDGVIRAGRPGSCGALLTHHAQIVGLQQHKI